MITEDLKKNKTNMKRKMLRWFMTFQAVRKSNQIEIKKVSSDK
jgi:hypothetical protein